MHLNKDDYESKNKIPFRTISTLIVFTITVVLYFIYKEKLIEKNDYINMFTVIGAISLTISWIKYINNKNLFSSIGFSFKKIISKKHREEYVDYFDYAQRKNKSTKESILFSFGYGIFSMLIVLILYLT